MALKPRNNVFASPFLEGATFAGKYEFPEVAPVHIQHLSAIPYDKISRKLREKSPLWVHHYVFDTRFQPMLKDPDDLYKHLQMYAWVIGLDNSLYRDMPLAEQIQSIFLNRLFDFRWQRLGMQVIPNVVWGDQRSFLFCYDGLPRHSTIAISSEGMMKARKNLFFFLDGFEATLEHLHPENIMFHGKLPSEAARMADHAGIPIQRIACRIQQVFSFMEVDHE